MKQIYEINTKHTDSINLSSFVADNVSTQVAMEIMMALYEHGFKPTENGMCKASGSISNNEVINVSYIMMASLPWPEELVPCVRYQYHREEWPGYEMIDHREDYEGGSTWESFKARFLKD